MSDHDGRQSAPLVLVAEDDPRQAEVLSRYFAAEGYTTTVVHDGVTALQQARVRAPDVIVLDVQMPGMSGLDVCRTLRHEPGTQADVPILMLTARSSEDDMLAGLDLGADDYLTKPYSPRELTARVRTLLRRTAAARRLESSPVLRVGPLTVDPAQRQASVAGRPIDCTPDEFDILAAMARRPESVFSRAQLLAHTRGLDRSSTGRSIDVHVMNLRRKIEADPRRPTLLRTVYGLGYRLSADPA